MLEARLLGQFSIRLASAPVDIPSRPAQSLLAYLLLNAGVTHRREKLAGLLWPDSPEPNARRNLRQALWHIRRALERGEHAAPYLLTDEITATFNTQSAYWLDAALLDRQAGDNASAEELMEAVTAYGGELLPGFYDEWVVLERERLEATFERKMQRLLDRLVEAQRWQAVLEWSERWIALGHVPEPAFRALMIARARLGDPAGVAAVYRRCVEALRYDLGVEPSDPTKALLERLTKGEWPAAPEVWQAQEKLEIVESPAPGEPPFKGLQHFDEADAGRFFGREALTARLAARLTGFEAEAQPARAASPFLAIVGASGSGKSSLVRAGLIAALRQNGHTPTGTPWAVRLIIPTTRPLEALGEVNLSPPEGERLLLVIDQFEELFTLCHNETQRSAFVDALMAAASPEAGGRTSVVIALRADFYAHCAPYAALREALAQNQEYIGPMNAEELRRAIEEPARRGGWEFEPGLVDLFLRDAGDEPGALPLLSHALLETWYRRRGRTLTLKGYAESGGIHGAIAKSAETVFQKLPAVQQTIARSIFLRLTELGEGTQDTRRRAALSELITHPELRPSVEAVLQTLADARLITVGKDIAEVAHEALIREWPTLRQWLAEDREGLKVHRRLTDAAQEWEALSREPSELYRGARLAQAVEWAAGHLSELNALEHEFLEASQAQATQEAAEREAQRERELEAARRLAEAEKRRAEEQSATARRLRQLVAGLAIAVVVAGMLALTAWTYSQQAGRNANVAQAASTQAIANAAAATVAQGQALDNAATAQVASTQAIANAATATVAQGQALNSAATAQADYARAESQRLAVEANRLLERGGNSDLIALLSLRSVQIQYSSEGDAALLGAMALDYPRRILSTDGQVYAVAFSPDGRYAITGSNDPPVAQLWDLQTGQSLRTFSGHTKPLTSVSMSPDGKYLLTSSWDNTARLWDVQTGQEVRQFAGHTDQLKAAVFSPDGQWVLTASHDQTARLWDAQTGAELRLFQHNSKVLSAAFSPDGQFILTGNEDQTARLWDLQTGRMLRTFAGHTNQVLSAVFSPDGQYVLTGSYDHAAKLWVVQTGQELRQFIGHTLGVTSVAFSPDGQFALTSGGDNTARLWDVQTGRQLRLLNSHTGAVGSAAFSPDGRYVLSGGDDSTARLWDVRTPPGLPQFAGHTGAIITVAFSPDGKYAATGGADKTVRLWEAQTGATVHVFAGPDIVQSVAFSADGRRLAVGAWGGPVQIWDTETGALAQEVAPPDAALSVLFSPDGRYLLTAGWSPGIRIWDLQTAAQPRLISGHTDIIYNMAFSPDGKYLLTGSYDTTARLWDFETGAEVLTFTGHTSGINSVAFSPDGRYIVTASLDRTAKLWDAQSGAEIRIFIGHTDIVWVAAFSPDGQYVLTSSNDYSLRLWDPQTGKEARRLLGHAAGIENAAFSPGGQYILSGSDDGVLRLWYTDYRDAIQYLCAHLLRDLSPAERAQYNLTGSEPTCAQP
jgi:WD40 repeat protein/DNA-binding SARP family transcriptional activator